jgi:uncharacterized protein
MVKSSSWLYFGLVAVVLAAGNTIFDFANDWQPVGLSICLSVSLLGGMAALRRFQSQSQSSQPISRSTLQQQLKQVEHAIAKISDITQRQQLLEQANQIAASLTQNQFRIAIFGMGSAGKTSVINALLGKNVGLTAPTIGTTKAREEYAYKSKENRRISLIDTPGTLEMGAEGRDRETLALELAQSSDLLIFVTPADLTVPEYQELVKLSGLGKRIILAFNKTDLYSPLDRQNILDSLTKHTAHLLSPQDIVAIAAQPQPIKVRQYTKVDAGNAQLDKEWLEPLPPEIAPLKTRIEQILSSEWEKLLLDNAHLQIQSLDRSVRDAIKQMRRQVAEQTVMRHQLLTAATVFASPLPGLDLVAGIALNTQLLIELSRLYEQSLSLGQAKRIVTVLAQILIKLGCVEVASAAIATCLKTNALTYAIGGSVQGLSAAYLTHIGGMSFIDYLEQEQPLQADAASIKNILSQLCQRQFAQTSAQGSKFLVDFVGSTLKRITSNDLALTSHKFLRSQFN